MFILRQSKGALKLSWYPDVAFTVCQLKKTSSAYTHLWATDTPSGTSASVTLCMCSCLPTVYYLPLRWVPVDSIRCTVCLQLEAVYFPSAHNCSSLCLKIFPLVTVELFLQISLRQLFSFITFSSSIILCVGSTLPFWFIIYFMWTSHVSSPPL